MSHERQRTVKDGEALVERDNISDLESTKGTLIHGSDHEGKAVSIKATPSGEITTSNKEIKVLLEVLIKEVKKINEHLSNITEID